MAYTEFYCNASTGSNMNGGSDENTSASYSATNGGWNETTGVFTPTSGDPSATVTVGQYAHVFTDGSSTPTFIARVIAVDSTTITVSISIKSGTPPTTAGTGISINVGGVWKGPNGSSGFPFNILQGVIRADASSTARVNFKNNATYDVTATMTGISDTGAIVFEGYTTTPGDGGMAKIDGGASGTRYQLLAVTAYTGKYYRYIWFTRNGATSTGQVLVNSSSTSHFYRCRFSHSSATGANGGRFFACEADNNTTIGFQLPSVVKRCISHHNGTGGYQLLGAIPRDCMSYMNGTYGYYVELNGAGQCGLEFCGAYRNGTHGALISKLGALAGTTFIFENSIFIDNSGFGIGLQGTGVGAMLELIRVGFGSGTMANVSGDIQTGHITMVNDISFNYPANTTPWVNPDSGNFSADSSVVTNSGFADFLQVDGVYSGTMSYPNMGPTQAINTTGGSGGYITTYINIIDPLTSTIAGI